MKTFNIKIPSRVGTIIFREVFHDFIVDICGRLQRHKFQQILKTGALDRMKVFNIKIPSTVRTIIFRELFHDFIVGFVDARLLKCE